MTLKKRSMMICQDEEFFIEHINRYIKRFRILSSRYRNKRRRFALRASLICAIYNLQHFTN